MVVVMGWSEVKIEEKGDTKVWSKRVAEVRALRISRDNFNFRQSFKQQHPEHSQLRNCQYPR